MVHGLANPTGIHEDLSSTPGITQWVKRFSTGVPVVVQWLMNPTGNQEVASSIPGLAQWVEDLALL